MVEVLEADVLIISRIDSNSLISVQLYGIEGPGKKNPYRNEAKRFTSRRTYGKSVDVTTLEAGEKGRTPGLVVANGRLLNQDVVHNGAGWVDRKTCRKSKCTKWRTLEDEARKARVGLWKRTETMPPFARGNDSGQGRSSAVGPYHGDLRKKVFHRPGCPEYDCFQCAAVFHIREDALKKGYKPHSVCKP